LNLRAFLRNAGLTALAGAAAGHPLTAAESAAALQVPSNGTFDFDTIYNRFGTDSTKFDQQIRVYGKDSVQVGMGIADIDFKAAPAITKAISERVKHENWGYLDMGKWTPMARICCRWNKSVRVTIDPGSMQISAGVHPALIAALKALAAGPRCAADADLQRPTPTCASRRPPEESPMKFVNGKFAMDFDDGAASASTRTRSSCNPQNPTGNCWSAVIRCGLARSPEAPVVVSGRTTATAGTEA
jgi:cystathionine beta-lyase